MSQPDPPVDADTAPDVVVTRPHRWVPSLIWLVPLIAALVGGWLAVRAVLDRGPTIQVSFTTAEGLEPGKTRVKYRSVDIGMVTEVAFGEKFSKVVATIELSRQSEALLVEDTQFWVVRPRLVGSEVSGLGTLLSGSYIGMDVGQSTKARREFAGLETPPLITGDRPGRRIDLRADDLASLDVGSPVYLRRVRVGQVIGFELDADGHAVQVSIFVNAPYDKFLASNTRFWRASGFNFELNATGVRADFQSLASLLIGGIAFETPDNSPTADPVDKAKVYRLFASRELAMKLPDTREEPYQLVFRETVRGLAPGAPVDFRGVVIGEVVSVDVETDLANASVRVPVGIRLYPARLLGRNTDARQPPDPRLMERMVARGLRAQLRTGSLLTGQLYVALDYFPKAEKGALVRTGAVAEIPTVPGSLTGLQESISALANKFEKFPLDQIGVDLRRALASLDTTLITTNKAVQRVDAELTPDLRAALADARRTFAAAEGMLKRVDSDLTPQAAAALAEARRTLGATTALLGQDAALQTDLRETLRQVTRAAESLRTLADYLERHPEALIRGRQAVEP